MNPGPVLHFLHLEDCEACKAARSALDRFEKAHPEVRVVRTDLAQVDWKSRWKPRMTPTYALVVPGRRTRIREGVHTRKELDVWLARATEKQV